MVRTSSTTSTDRAGHARPGRNHARRPRSRRRRRRVVRPWCAGLGVAVEPAQQRAARATEPSADGTGELLGLVVAPRPCVAAAVVGAQVTTAARRTVDGSSPPWPTPSSAERVPVVAELERGDQVLGGPVVGEQRPARIEARAAEPGRVPVGARPAQRAAQRGAGGGAQRASGGQQQVQHGSTVPSRSDSGPSTRPGAGARSGATGRCRPTGRVSAVAFFDRLLRAGEGKKVKALAGLVPEINAIEPEIEALSDDELAAKTPEFRQPAGQRRGRRRPADRGVRRHPRGRPPGDRPASLRRAADGRRRAALRLGRRDEDR